MHPSGGSFGTHCHSAKLHFPQHADTRSWSCVRSFGLPPACVKTPEEPWEELLLPLLLRLPLP